MNLSNKSFLTNFTFRNSLLYKELRIQKIVKNDKVDRLVMRRIFLYVLIEQPIKITNKNNSDYCYK